jgi:hypothetical protein
MRCDFSATMDEQGDVRLDGHMVCYEPWIDGTEPKRRGLTDGDSC